jgi:hypothetical protein
MKKQAAKEQDQPAFSASDMFKMPHQQCQKNMNGKAWCVQSTLECSLHCVHPLGAYCEWTVSTYRCWLEWTMWKVGKRYKGDGHFGNDCHLNFKGKS